MTTQKDTNRGVQAVTAEDVADYLSRNPGFFNDHPGLLAEMEVPHTNSGETVSLVERQVSIMREANQKLHKQLHELIEIARQNEELAHRMHQLALTLMDAVEPDEIFATLYDNLRRNFHADRVIVRLFADPAFIDSCAGAEFSGRDVPEMSLFKTIIDRREPLCGQMKHQQRVFLFGDDGNEIASSVMVPLHGPGWDGLLAIGSFDRDRFQPGMGVELLANMGEVLSFILKPWIAEP